MTKIAGKHTFKFGGMYQKGSVQRLRPSVRRRVRELQFLGTGLPRATTNSGAGGNAFASFLLGWATNGQIDTVRYIGQKWPYFAGYVQDDWSSARS